MQKSESELDRSMKLHMCRMCGATFQRLLGQTLHEHCGSTLRVFCDEMAQAHGGVRYARGSSLRSSRVNNRDSLSSAYHLVRSATARARKQRASSNVQNTTHKMKQQSVLCVGEATGKHQAHHLLELRVVLAHRDAQHLVASIEQGPRRSENVYENEQNVGSPCVVDVQCFRRPPESAK